MKRVSLEMIVRKSKSLKVSITMSILFHAVVLFSIVWIKLGSEYNTSERLNVTLLKNNKTKLLQRSTPARAIPSFSVSSHQYFPETTVKLNSVNQSPSPVIYADKASLKLFSTIDIMPYNIPQNTGIQQTYHKFIARPIIAKVKDSVQKPTSNLGVTEGYKFFNNTPTLDKHIVNVDDDNSEDLRQFLALIRKKIESKKKYPMSARNAGIEGRSEVKITILRDGQLEKVEIIDSSGSEILDNAALESVREANPFPPIPSNLGRDKIEMSIYLTFRIG